MRLKPGVKFGNPIMAICFAAMVAESVFQKYNYDCIITSVNDSTHGANSLHYSDCAFDLRTKHIAYKMDVKKIASEIKESLGEHFDIVFESEGAVNEHIHLEYDPK
jgi:hypothetical protein